MSQNSSEITPDNSKVELSSDQNESPPAEEKLEKIKIILDNPQNTYTSGQTVRGTITLNCAQRTQIRGIYFRVIGKGKCNWTDLLRRDSIPVNKSDKPDIRYWGDEEFIDATVYVIGSKNGRPFTLLKGTTTYHFTYNLDSKLPSSFSGDCGKIKFNLEFVVEKPLWKFDVKQVVPLNVIQTVDLNKFVDTLKPYEQQLTKTIGIIGSGPISLYVSMPKRGYVFGELIQVQATVTNNSKVRAEKIKFSFYRVIEYHSISPIKATKKVSERLVKKVIDGVDKKTEQKFEQTIDVPVTTPTQDSQTSKLIHITFELEVEVKLPRMHKNLIVSVPITVGTVPFYIQEQEQAILRSSLPSDDSSYPRLSGFSNFSLDLYSQRSSMMSHCSPTAPTAMMPNSSIGSPMSSDPSYPMLPISPLSPVSPYSPQAIMMSNNFLPQDRPMSMNYPPSAPPMDLNAAISSTPMRPHSLFIRPPAYDEVFGLPGQMSQMNISNDENTKTYKS